MFSILAYFSLLTRAFFQGLAAAYCLRVMPRVGQGFSGGEPWGFRVWGSSHKRTFLSSTFSKLSTPTGLPR